MAITGMHGLLYTQDADRLRALLRDVFGFTHVDAGGGWLIFTMPPAELGVHPAEGPSWDAGTRHLISFMCDDINATIAELRGKGITVTDGPKDQGYGITAMLQLPGGCEVMIYEPRHPIAAGMKRAAAKRPARKKAAKKAASPRRGRRATRAGRRR
jgi:predicted enzyme related to lactoylglutathione lyase